MASSMSKWLASLSPDQLQDVLERTGATQFEARANNLGPLAHHLQQPRLVHRMMYSLPAPAMQIIETASALGGSPTISELSSMLDGSGSENLEQDIISWIEIAGPAALIWLDGERIRLNAGLDYVLNRPFVLARPIRMILPNVTVDMLRRTLRAAGLPIPAGKRELTRAVRGALTDPAVIRRIVAKAPPEVLSTLSEHVLTSLRQARSIADYQDPAVPEPDPHREFVDQDAYARQHAMRMWATEHGLNLGWTSWNYAGALELPTEVYLALATPDFRLPFYPQPPMLTLLDIPPEQLNRTSAAAIGEFLGTAMAILEAARDGLAVLQGGGIGTRELTRFAKQVGTDIPTVRLVLELGASLKLLEQEVSHRTGNSTMRITERFEEWRRTAPARRAADLCREWLWLADSPTVERDHDGKYLPLFGQRRSQRSIPLPLHMSLTLSIHPGRGALNPQQLFDMLRWESPMNEFDAVTGEQTWAEAHQVGILAEGALAPFAEALIRGDQEQGVELLAQMLPNDEGRVLFGSDLTVVIAGNPAPDAVDLLDIVATRETHGVVGTWRVTESSVRAALDSGYTVDDLLTALRELADQPLPQALEYVLKDVARKHGNLGVRAATSVITADDPALLAEVVAHRKLRDLSLSLVAPTVAVTSKPVTKTLTALRTAGFLPIELGKNGIAKLKPQRLPNHGG